VGAAPAAENHKTKRQALEAFWKTVDLSDGQAATWKPKPELLEFLASLLGADNMRSCSPEVRRSLPRQTTA
jgi:hypothetical protein